VTASEFSVDIQGLEVRAGKAHLLGPIDLQVTGGAHLLLVGRSGCGKTTLLRAIAGFGPIIAGRIELLGRVVQDARRQVVQPQDRGVGLLFQGGALWPHMKVAQTLHFVLKAGGIERSQRNSKVARLLELVELTGFDKRSVPTLSGGEAQRLALARALALEPKILALDEPLGPLDVELRQGLLQRLDRLQKDLGLTLLHVTHDPEEAAGYADRRVRLADGKLQSDESLAQASQ
jgi:ABC-type Fe3+/spermidine/putrescine transport system ATPase subunit